MSPSTHWATHALPSLLPKASLSPTSFPHPVTNSLSTFVLFFLQYRKIETGHYQSKLRDVSHSHSHYANERKANKTKLNSDTLLITFVPFHQDPFAHPFLLHRARLVEVSQTQRALPKLYVYPSPCIISVLLWPLNVSTPYLFTPNTSSQVFLLFSS